LEEYATVDQGLAAQGLKVMPFQDKLYLQDTESNLFINMKAVLNINEYNRFALHFEVSKLADDVKPDSFRREPLPETTSPAQELLVSSEIPFEKEDEIARILDQGCRGFLFPVDQ
jgi:hypothetical protein